MSDLTKKELKWQTTTESTGGSNELLAAVAGSRYRIYRVSFSPVTDVTGQVIILEGATAKFSIQSPKAGAEYGFDLNGQAFVELATNTALNISLPAGSNPDTDVNVFYELVTP